MLRCRAIVEEEGEEGLLEMEMLVSYVEVLVGDDDGGELLLSARPFDENNQDPRARLPGIWDERYIAV